MDQVSALTTHCGHNLACYSKTGFSTAPGVVVTYPIVEASQNHTRALYHSRAEVGNAPDYVARLLGPADMPSGAWNSKRRL